MYCMELILGKMESSVFVSGVCDVFSHNHVPRCLILVPGAGAVYQVCMVPNTAASCCVPERALRTNNVVNVCP